MQQSNSCPASQQLVPSSERQERWRNTVGMSQVQHRLCFVHERCVSKFVKRVFDDTMLEPCLSKPQKRFRSFVEKYGDYLRPSSRQARAIVLWTSLAVSGSVVPIKQLHAIG